MCLKTKKMDNKNQYENYWTPPEYLNEEFFLNILKTTEKDPSIILTSFYMKPAIGKGEHFASCMYRVKISYAGKLAQRQISFVVKASFEDEFVNGTLNEYDIYKQEMKMYKNYLPIFKKYLSQINEDSDISPRTFYINFENDVIVFEDLAEKGYRMADRTDGLDMTHAKMVIEKMAKLHAASLIYNKKSDGDLEKTFIRGMFNRQSDGLSPYFLANLQSLASEVSNWKGYEQIASKLQNMRSSLIENGRKVFDATDGYFNCLIHGDLWTNNVMFKYDENNKPEDVLLVDFQMCVWGSPAVDIHYFINTSLNDDLRENHQDELFYFYYTTLVDLLKRLKYSGKIPSLYEFLMEALGKMFYAFSSCCLVLPVMMTETEIKPDFKMLLGLDEFSDDFRNIIFKDAKLQKILKRVLPIFERKGILDL